MGESGDLLHSNHKWRCSSRALGLGSESQVLGVIRNQHANEENTENVEHDDSPEGELDGLGNGLSGVLGLANGHTNKFSTYNELAQVIDARMNALTEEGKGGLHHGRPERKELAEVSLDIFVIEGTRAFPIPETSSVVVGTTAKCEDERGQDDSQDDNDLES